MKGTICLDIDSVTHPKSFSWEEKDFGVCSTFSS